MSNPSVYVVIFTLFGAIGTADAAYLIKLKNGNEYVTARYWHEGNQVLFDTYGGVFGIDKAFISKINPTDHAKPVSMTAQEPVKSETAESKDTMGNQQENQESRKPKDRKADDPIVEEFSRLKQNAKDVDGMLTGEIAQLLGQLTDFKRKISRDSKLFVEYGREFNDAQELASQVEAALRARTQ